MSKNINVSHITYLIFKYLDTKWEKKKKTGFKNTVLRILIIGITAYLFSKYVLGNWDNIKHFIYNLFQ